MNKSKENVVKLVVEEIKVYFNNCLKLRLNYKQLLSDGTSIKIDKRKFMKLKELGFSIEVIRLNSQKV